MRAETPPRNTKWLDGLRGLAAAIVAFDRLFLGELDFPFRSFWADPPAQNRVWLQLAPLRLIFGARAMVTLFFVVSGYAISINLLRVRHRRQEFLNEVASAATRRIFRLFLPVLAVVCLSQFLFFINLSHPTTSLHGDYAETFHAKSNKLRPWCAPWGHLQYVVRYMVDIVNPFVALHYKNNKHLDLNEQLWTMPVEFRGSCLVYFLVVALAPWKAPRRSLALVVLSVYFLWYGMWDIATFIAGLWLAELKVAEEGEQQQTDDDQDEELGNSLLQPATNTSPPSSLSSSSSSSSSWSGSLDADSKKTRRIMSPLSIVNLILFALGIHLLCLGDEGILTRGYRGLLLFQPSSWEKRDIVHYSWKSVGAVMVVYAISNSPRWLLQRPLETSRVIQYMGRISFSLYLIQQIVYNLLRDPVKNWIWKDLAGYAYPGGHLSGREPFAQAVMWIGTTMILGPLLVFLADAFTRYVDVPCLALARRAQMWLM
jgi:peptidoglycan/LPS O-acetylase OafA/YrhL